ncbi:hypothetical protein LP417_30775 [Polaromonas sp. P1-6]|nr:hypothetical protein LP417_30775 [Polaromonas sp. P1-6]UUZ68295.1 hypothetical protein LP416_29530 [Polaromonas sp. P2-4]
MSSIDLQALIPNNVHLGENRQLQRAGALAAGFPELVGRDGPQRLQGQGSLLTLN